MLEEFKYYIGRLNSDKKTGHLFSFIKFPSDVTVEINAMIIMVISASIEMLGSTHFILPVILIILCQEMIYRYIVRMDILYKCIDEELDLREALIREGDDDVTEEDRWGIFETHIRRYKNKKIGSKNKFKNRLRSLAYPTLYFLAAYMVLNVISSI